MMLMPRTRAQIEAAAASAEEWLETVDPASLTAEDTSDLRDVAAAFSMLVEAEQRLTATVAAAREGGRSWARIGMVLGVSKEAARQRYSTPVDAERS